MQETKCNSISVYQEIENGLFGGPYNLELYDKGISIHVEQWGIRKTTISSNNEVIFSDLINQFTRLDRLMMIFDGEFYPITKIETNSHGNTNILDLDDFTKTRISSYKSAPLVKGNHSSLLSPFCCVNNEMFAKWKELDDELNLVHQMYVYTLSDNGFPIDGKIAFMIYDRVL